MGRAQSGVARLQPRSCLQRGRLRPLPRHPRAGARRPRPRLQCTSLLLAVWKLWLRGLPRTDRGQGARRAGSSRLPWKAEDWDTRGDVPPTPPGTPSNENLRVSGSASPLWPSGLHTTRAWGPAFLRGPREKQEGLCGGGGGGAAADPCTPGPHECLWRTYRRVGR